MTYIDFPMAVAFAHAYAHEDGLRRRVTRRWDGWHIELAVDPFRNFDPISYRLTETS